MDLYRQLMTTDGHKDICDFRPNKDSPPTWKDKLFMDKCKVSFEEGKIERQDKKTCKKSKSLDVNNNVLFESPETASATRLDNKNMDQLQDYLHANKNLSYSSQYNMDIITSQS